MIHFDKSKLPSPLEFYRQVLAGVSGSAGWCRARCPFHDDKQPSFSFHAIEGGYNCHGCQETGGDIIDFYRRMFGVDYAAAIRGLERREY